MADIINDLNPEQFADIFGAMGTPNPANPAGPQRTEANFDISNTPPAPSASDAPVEPLDGEADLTADEPVEEGQESQEGQEGQPSKGRKPKYNFTDTVGYFEDRIKNGIFVPIEEEVNGQVQPFIPKTPEEFDQFIQFQADYKLQKLQEEESAKWYSSKPPAWQAVAQYSEMVDDPADIIPFIQGVQNIQSVSGLDETKEEDAEQILRIRYQQRGDTKEIIDDQIDALRSSNKLLTTAASYKPIILKQEQAQLQQMMHEREQEQQEYARTINTIREKTLSSLQQPFYGKRLKEDEQRTIYELIGIPDKESQGYRIYSEIDNLFQQGDFETLKQIALLVKKKDAFFSYINADVATKTSQQLQRTLRVAADGKQVAQRPVAEEQLRSQQQQQNRTQSGGIKLGRR